MSYIQEFQGLCLKYKYIQVSLWCSKIAMYMTNNQVFPNLCQIFNYIKNFALYPRVSMFMSNIQVFPGFCLMVSKSHCHNQVFLNLFRYLNIAKCLSYIQEFQVYVSYPSIDRFLSYFLWFQCFWLISKYFKISVKYLVLDLYISTYNI